MRILPLHFLMLPRYLFQTLNFIQFSPFSDYLLRQILPKETPMQEQELNSPLNDPIGVEGDPVDSPAQHATDGMEVICPFYSSTIIMN